MRRLQRILLIALAVCCLTGAAAAGPLPDWSAVLERYASGTPHTLELAARLDAWPDLAADSLTAVQSWLTAQRLVIRFLDKDGAAQAQASWLADEAELFVLHTLETAERAEMTLAVPDTLPATAYLGTPARPAWQALLGQNPRFPRVAEALDALSGIAALALPRLLPFEKPVKTAISIRHAGRGASQLVYTLKKDEAQLLWDEARPGLLPLLDRMLLALAPGRAEALSASLRTLEMKGALTLKRILDKEGRDLGLQLTATFALDGQTRKLTLFGGHADSGLYWSLKLPATRGADTLEALLSLKTETGGVEGEWKYKSVSGKQRVDTSGTVDLQSAADGAGQRLTGQLTARLRRDGLTTDYSLTPDLTLLEGAVQGSLRLLESRAKSPRRDLTLSLGMRPGERPQAPLALSEVNLAALDEGQTAALSARISAALAPALNRFLHTLPPALRRLVLHDLGRDRRALDDKTSPPVNTPPTFTVNDEAVQPTTEEETP